MRCLVAGSAVREGFPAENTGGDVSYQDVARLSLRWYNDLSNAIVLW